ncbi:hypothetical protein HN011_004629, partial [Eciton burchellii]
MSTRYANDLTVRELREELRKLGLVATGGRRELVTRLNRSTSGGIWSELPIEAQMSGSMVEIANERSSQEQSECGQERRTTETQSIIKSQEILEKELEILKRELELMKARFANNSTR